MSCSWLLNVIGLVFSTIAAALMYYYPPRGIDQFTGDGSPYVQWIGSITKEGKDIASRQAFFAKVAPVLLGLGFLLQLGSAFLQIIKID
jgi:hypothetical protein